MTVLAFGGIVVRSGPGVIVPRPWTLAQSAWAAEVAAGAPAGPMLELCAGCGVIGLEAARRSGRRVVLVDSSAEACRWAAGNVAANGLDHLVEIRTEPVDRALRPGETFPVILADPPYVPRADVARYPEDPVTAIDGGDDGLAVVPDILRAVAGHLAPGGTALVQTRGPGQAEAVARLAAGHGLCAGAVRVVDADRAVIALHPGAG